MAQEIELKFIVNSDAVDALRERLNTLGGEHHAPSQLLNIYYETPDAWLRGHDMGLRIRGENGHYEMTMKIAGRVTGGLHQQPWTAQRGKAGVGKRHGNLLQNLGGQFAPEQSCVAFRPFPARGVVGIV